MAFQEFPRSQGHVKGRKEPVRVLENPLPVGLSQPQHPVPPKEFTQVPVPDSQGVGTDGSHGRSRGKDPYGLVFQGVQKVDHPPNPPPRIEFHGLGDDGGGASHGRSLQEGGRRHHGCQVGVAVDEPRDHGPSPGVNDPGSWTGGPVRALSHPGDPVAAHADPGIVHHLPGIDVEQPGVDHQEVRVPSAQGRVHEALEIPREHGAAHALSAPVRSRSRDRRIRRGPGRIRSRPCRRGRAWHGRRRRTGRNGLTVVFSDWKTRTLRRPLGPGNRSREFRWFFRSQGTDSRTGA